MELSAFMDTGMVGQKRTELVRLVGQNYERDQALPSLPALWVSCMLVVIILNIEEELRWASGTGSCFSVAVDV